MKNAHLLLLLVYCGVHNCLICWCSTIGTPKIPTSEPKPTVLSQMAPKSPHPQDEVRTYISELTFPIWYWDWVTRRVSGAKQPFYSRDLSCTSNIHPERSNANPEMCVEAHSIRNPESFWTHQAEQLYWHKRPSRALVQLTKKLFNGTSHPSFTWFPDGEISTSYNCVDRHVKNGNGDSVAIIWDSPVTGSKENYTYSQLLQEVETLAGVLREEGVRKGDVVLVYSIDPSSMGIHPYWYLTVPMIPSALFAILAISRLGAIHTVVFGGFAPASLAQRIEASKPRAIMTASCGMEGSKGAMDYKPFIEGALQKSRYKPERIIVWQREQLRWHPVLKERGERSWQGLMKSARNRGIKAEAVPVKSSDGIYIIYTRYVISDSVLPLLIQILSLETSRESFYSIDMFQGSTHLI